MCEGWCDQKFRSLRGVWLCAVLGASFGPWPEPRSGTTPPLVGRLTATVTVIIVSAAAFRCWLPTSRAVRH
eukprot:6910401-Prymnesium_polylepis.1